MTIKYNYIIRYIKYIFYKTKLNYINLIILIYTSLFIL